MRQTVDAIGERAQEIDQSVSAAVSAWCDRFSGMPQDAGAAAPDTERRESADSHTGCLRQHDPDGHTRRWMGATRWWIPSVLLRVHAGWLGADWQDGPLIAKYRQYLAKRQVTRSALCTLNRSTSRATLPWTPLWADLGICQLRSCLQRCHGCMSISGRS